MINILADRVGSPRCVCSFGITEAIAAFAIPEIAGLGAAAGGAAGAGELAADAGLALGAGGLAEAAGGAAGGFGDLLGGLGGVGGLGDVAGSGSTLGLGAATGPVASPLGGGLGGLAAPASAAGGLAPAGATPIDLASASAAGAGGVAPGGDATALFTGSNITTLGAPTTEVPITGSPSALAGGSSNFDLSGAGFAGGAPNAGAGAGGDLSALTGGANGGNLSSLTGGATTGAGTGAPAGGIVGGEATAGNSGSFFDSLLGGATKSVTSNPLGIALAAGGLGYNILQGQKLSANQQALQAAAGTEAANAQQLTSYINSGQLPPGMAAQVANATAAAKAAIISGYAAKGQNANPSQNSALQQELNQVDMNAQALQGQLATQLLNAGLTESGLSNNLYAQLIQMDQAQAKLTGAAIANFSAALAGGPKSINIGNTSA